MMSAPVARTLSGFIALTVAAVPTGMNAGVRISPRRMAMRPVRAFPSLASMEKAKRGASEAIDEREPGLGVGRDRAGRRVAVIVHGIGQTRREALAEGCFEAGCEQQAGRVRVDDDRGRAPGIGHHVGIL